MQEHPLMIQENLTGCSHILYIFSCLGNGVSKLSEVRRATTEAYIKFGDTVQVI